MALGPSVSVADAVSVGVAVSVKELEPTGVALTVDVPVALRVILFVAAPDSVLLEVIVLLARILVFV